MKKVIILLLSMAFGLQGYAQKTKLQLNLKVGETYKQTSNVKSTIDQEFMGQQMVTTNTLQGTVSFKVLSANKKGYELEVQYDRLSMVMELPQGMSIELDTDKESKEGDLLSETMGGMLRNMVGKTFNISMTKYGRITDMKNVEVLFESMFDVFPNLSTEQIQPIKDQLAESFGSESLKSNFEMFTALFPEKKVKQGATWTINTKLQSAFPTIINPTYTFVEKTANYILLTGEGAIEIDPDADQGFGSFGSTQMDMTGTVVSSIKLDPKTGWIISATMVQKIKGNVLVKEVPETAEGVNIKMSFRNDITVGNK